MICDCCGRKKKLFESFAKIKHKDVEINLCVNCNDLMYKIRDAYNENNDEDYRKFNNMIDAHEKKSQKEFLVWKKSFVDNLSRSKAVTTNESDKK